MPDSFSIGSIDKLMVQSYCTVFCQRQYCIRIINIVTSKRRVDPGGGRKCIIYLFSTDESFTRITRSSLIHSACIGAAPPRLFTPEATLWSCLSKSGWMVDRYFFQNASQGNLCKYTKFILVSKELKTVCQNLDQKPRYLIKSIYSGKMSFHQIRSCPSHSQELNSILIDTQCLMLSQIIQMLREHDMRLILTLYDGGDYFTGYALCKINKDNYKM